MAYRFNHGDKSVHKALRRIALDQIDKALTEIDDDRLDVEKTVHQVRKRCKKLRGLIRLVRPSFDAYAAENALLRDAARIFSHVRDVTVLQAAYDMVVNVHGDEIDRPAVAPIRRHLTQRRKAVTQRPHAIDENFAEFRIAMLATRDRARHWELKDSGFDGLAGGLGRTYKRAKNAMAHAANDTDPQKFHDWRKRIKYHGYHMRILAPIWPEAMQARHRAAERLGDLLGAHHDLEMFRQTLAADPDSFARHNVVETMTGLVRRRQASLAQDAFPLGARLLAEPSIALLQRSRTYWDVWRGSLTMPPTAA